MAHTSSSISTPGYTINIDHPILTSKGIRVPSKRNPQVLNTRNRFFQPQSHVSLPTCVRALLHLSQTAYEPVLPASNPQNTPSIISSPTIQKPGLANWRQRKFKVVQTNFGPCIGECMVAIININDGIKAPTHEYENCNTSQIPVFGGYFKMRRSLCTWAVI